MNDNLRGQVRRVAVQSQRLLRALALDPSDVLRKWRGMPVFLENMSRWRQTNDDPAFDVSMADLRPIPGDRFKSAGVAKGHYFLQDLWVARQLYGASPDRHVDVGSRIDGFIAQLLVFTEVTYVDLRPLKSRVSGLEFVQGSITELPFEDGSVDSLSCLHVLEHIGLGRYGGPVDPDAYKEAAASLSRVLAPSGRLLLSTPVGRERLCFDAHRVFDPFRIPQIFGELELEHFALIDDVGEQVLEEVTLADAASCDYGCGIYTFRK